MFKFFSLSTSIHEFGYLHIMLTFLLQIAVNNVCKSMVHIYYINLDYLQLLNLCVFTEYYILSVLV